MGIGLPVANFLDISPSPPAPLPGGEGGEPANPLLSQREMVLCRVGGIGDALGNHVHAPRHPRNRGWYAPAGVQHDYGGT